MHPVLQKALDESVVAFGVERVVFTERPDGSVRVTVLGFDLGDTWSPQVAQIATVLLVSFPATQPYPFYLPTNLNRTNGKAMPQNYHGWSSTAKRSSSSLCAPWATEPSRPSRN